MHKVVGEHRGGSDSFLIGGARGGTEGRGVDQIWRDNEQEIILCFVEGYKRQALVLISGRMKECAIWMLSSYLDCMDGTSGGSHAFREQRDPGRV